MPPRPLVIHDEEETQNASAHHVLKIISRSPWAARSFTSVGSLHYVAAPLGVVARSLGAPHAAKGEQRRASSAEGRPVARGGPASTRTTS